MFERLDFLRELTRELSAAGVPIILGTDSPGIPGMFPGFSIRDDVRTLVDAGLTPFESLAAGTRNQGAFLERFLPGSHPIGTVRVNARADLVLLDADPLLDLAALGQIAGVMVRGRWLPQDELSALMEDIATSGSTVTAR